MRLSGELLREKVRTITKWDLLLGCKNGSTYENQLGNSTKKE